MGKSKVKSGCVFERREKKYLLTPERYELLVERLTNYMEFDEYGLHTIHTIYYDTDEFDVARHSASKPKFKQKMRLRSYGEVDSSSPVFLELKKKVAGVTYKRRSEMTYLEASNFLNYRVAPRNQEQQIFKEIKWYTEQQDLKRTVLISYDRLAMRGKTNPEFRITFDHKIRYSFDQFNLHHVDSSKQKLLTSKNLILMEVKILGAFPLEISKLFSELGIFQEKFTKYGNVYQWILYPKWEEQKMQRIHAQNNHIISQEEQANVKLSY